MITHQSAPARLVDGLINFRDVGGVPTATGGLVRPGLVFRSDSLDNPTPGTSAALADLDVGVVVDLRSAEEIEMFGRVDQPAIDWRHAPIGAKPSEIRKKADRGLDAMELNYQSMTEDSAAAVAGVLRIIADTDVPMVFHCTSGKDRTGVIAALVQLLLGVDDAVVEAEYSESSRDVDHHIEVMRSKYPQMASTFPPDQMRRMAGTDPAWLDVALAPVRSAGGPLPWLARVTDADDATRIVTRLQDRLLS